MLRPLTAEDLANYRKYRIKIKRFGRRSIAGDRWTEYQDLNDRVTAAVEDLPGRCRDVARMYYIDAMSCVAVSMRIYYSERHVRRLRQAAVREIVTT